MTLTQAMKMKRTKTHIAEPDKLTLCGRPSTPVKYVSSAQAAIHISIGERYWLCQACVAADRKLRRGEGPLRTD